MNHSQSGSQDWNKGNLARDGNRGGVFALHWGLGLLALAGAQDRTESFNGKDEGNFMGESLDFTFAGLFATELGEFDLDSWMSAGVNVWGKGGHCVW